ncbi:MAG: hypothetical protein ACK4WK_10090, partial [Anaerolineae bacterium]
MDRMSSAQVVRQQVYRVLEELPPESLEEVAQFLEFLRFKYRKGEAKVIALGGLWRGLDRDVSEEDVRALRRRVTERALERGGAG